MPGTGNAAVDDFAFAQWTVLVLTDIGNRRNFAVVLEDSNLLSGNGDNFGAVFWNFLDAAHLHKPVITR